MNEREELDTIGGRLEKKYVGEILEKNIEDGREAWEVLLPQRY